MNAREPHVTEIVLVRISQVHTFATVHLREQGDSVNKVDDTNNSHLLIIYNINAFFHL
jgi:hypothetical protein